MIFRIFSGIWPKTLWKITKISLKWVGKGTRKKIIDVFSKVNTYMYICIYMLKMNWISTYTCKDVKALAKFNKNF
jgi:hypothetical protein